MYIGGTNYHYIECLVKCTPPASRKSAQGELHRITTPLQLVHWKSMLAGHPDREYIISGIRDGFGVGYNHGLMPLSSGHALGRGEPTHSGRISGGGTTAGSIPAGGGARSALDGVIPNCHTQKERAK